MKKNIDSIFKNKLDAPQNPPLDAWENIQSQLPQKQKRRIFPLWMMFSAIGSLALIVVGGSYFFINSAEESLINPSKNSNEISILENNSSQKSQFHDLENSIHNEIYSNKINQEINIFKEEEINNNSNDFHNYSLPLSINENSNKNTKPNSLDTYESNKLIPEEKIHSKNLNLNKNKSKENQDFVFIPNNSFKVENDYLEESIKSKENKKLHENLLVKNKKKKETAIKGIKKIDFDRFHVSAFASPMALNTFVGSSMLSDDMKDFKTENSITLAYGIKGAYSLSPHLKIRTGISKVGFEQITKNVPLAVDMSNGPNASSFISNNINYKSEIRISSDVKSMAGLELGRSTVGNIQQQSEYIEIPLEVELAVLQTSSIGISATGGASTWLLSKNKIYVKTEDYTEELGKANNVNKASFSANAGLKFDMKIMDNVQLNVEPNFKYLMNTVNNIEKYNPYTVGVNAGITVSLK